MDKWIAVVGCKGHHHIKASVSQQQLGSFYELLSHQAITGSKAEKANDTTSSVLPIFNCNMHKADWGSCSVANQDSLVTKAIVVAVILRLPDQPSRKLLLIYAEAEGNAIRYTVVQP